MSSSQKTKCEQHIIEMRTDRHFDFSIIEMIIPPRERQINGKQSQCRLVAALRINELYGSLRPISLPFSHRSLNTIAYYFSQAECLTNRRFDIFSDSIRAKLLCAETFWRQDVTRGSRGFQLMKQLRLEAHNPPSHTFRHNLMTWQDLGPIPTGNPSRSSRSDGMLYLVSLVQPSALFLRSNTSCV